VLDETPRFTDAVQRMEESAQLSSWENVQKSRRLGRPGAMTFIDLICDSFMELYGDRLYGDDPAMVGGIGIVDGRPITFIGNRKGTNLKENVLYNYGMSNPEGYRKALRLARQAEKFGRPVVCFIDTPGAYPGLESEERGIGEAIAQNLKVFATLRTPILVFIIGEGGSGGALGIGVGDKLYMLESAVYSVITPEGFASILLRDPSKAAEAAEAMKMTASHLKEFGVIHDIIAEGSAEETASRIKAIINRDLDVLCSKPTTHLVRYRIRKIRGIGEVSGIAKTWWKPLLGVFGKTEHFF
jgi:acetyl-CoA carboxylase carboxyl transferase subunit alpha